MGSDKVSGVTLGTVIAFVAPGFIGLRAAAYHIPIAASWIDAASAKEQDVGVFFFVVLASLSIGVVLSGLRSTLLDSLFFRDVFRLKALQKPVYNFASLSEEHTLRAFEAIVENYYKFYQFYGNTLVAAAVLWLSHQFAGSTRSWPLLAHALYILSMLALFVSARQSLSRFSESVTQLFQGTDDHVQRLAEEARKGRSEEKGGEEDRQEGLDQEAP